jgi:hypothetical protein
MEEKGERYRDGDKVCFLRSSFLKGCLSSTPQDVGADP